MSRDSQKLLDNAVTISIKCFSTNYHLYPILPNKRTCLNKCTPDFWFYPAISQKPLSQSESNFKNLLLRYSLKSLNWNLTRIRARFMPPHPVWLFGEDRISQTLGILGPMIWHQHFGKVGLHVYLWRWWWASKPRRRCHAPLRLRLRLSSFADISMT